jgi:hypothetical protein
MDANVNAMDRQGGRMPLMISADRGPLEATKALDEFGANMAAVDRLGFPNEHDSDATW